MSTLHELKKAEELLNDVLKDINNLGLALEQWPSTEGDDYALLESAKWQLIYIEHDFDIRARDPDYEHAQLSALQALFVKIQQRVKLTESKPEER